MMGQASKQAGGEEEEERTALGRVFDSLSWNG